MRQYVLKIQIWFFLLSIYLVPYKVMLVLFPVFSILCFTLDFFVFKKEYKVQNKKHAFFLTSFYLVLLFLLLVSSYFNQVGATDILLSSAFYCFPVFGVYLFSAFGIAEWNYLLSKNKIFVFLQIPFLIVQFLFKDGTTDDWFKGSAMEGQNTQIVAFVFFVNFWVYLSEYYRTKKGLPIIVLCFLLAFATNTNLQSGLFLLIGAIYLISKLRLRTILYAVISFPLIFYISYKLMQFTNVSGFESVQNTIEMAIEEPDYFSEVGKIRGVTFGVNKLSESSKNFFWGVGPGVAASKVTLYKTDEAETKLTFLDPLRPIYYDFIEGLFIRSNLMRPWSSISAIILEGGILLIIAFCWYFFFIGKSLCYNKETKAILGFIIGCLLLEQVVDNIKMNLFITAVFFLFAAQRKHYGKGRSFRE